MGFTPSYKIEPFEVAKENFLLVPEVAERYRTSSPMIYRWVSENRFPENVVFRLGRKILFHRQNLEAFEAQGGELLKNKDKALKG